MPDSVVVAFETNRAQANAPAYRELDDAPLSSQFTQVEFGAAKTHPEREAEIADPIKLPATQAVLETGLETFRPERGWNANADVGRLGIGMAHGRSSLVIPLKI